MLDTAGISNTGIYTRKDTKDTWTYLGATISAKAVNMLQDLSDRHTIAEKLMLPFTVWAIISVQDSKIVWQCNEFSGWENTSIAIE